MQQVPGQRVIRHSSWYLSEPVGLEDPEWFINGVAWLETDLGPQELLHRMLAIEAQMGRKRTVKWGPRTIDLDLLAFDQVILRTAELILPHPQAEKRRFVLEPWAEIAPNYRHPVLKKSILRLKEEAQGCGQAVFRLDEGNRGHLQG